VDSIRAAFVAVALLVVIAVAGCGDEAKPKGVQGGSEVTAEPVSSTGDNPFTDAVGKDEGDVKPPRAAVSSGGPSSYSGGLPGLYGGTRNYATCNPEKMVDFLEHDPSKARAWADVLEISTTEIRSYVDDLTPVTLRTDTRVTNHGFVGGRANAIQSVLQAGTAVLVNRYGEPVVKCYCGNPLRPPVAYTSPVYTGPRWTDFAPSHITIIKETTTVIKEFKIYDLKTGKTFTRPAGSDGSDDGEFTGEEPEADEPPDDTAPEPSTPAEAPERPSAAFTPNPGSQGDTFTLGVNGFKPGATVDVLLTRPDGVTEHYSINVRDDGTGLYTFTNTQDVITGTYHAAVTNPDTGAKTETSLQVLPSGGG
jgi:Domain of unknown function (DUF6777)